MSFNQLAAYFFKKNFFHRPQNERHCVSCRHVATCLRDMSRKHVSYVTSEERHFVGLRRHYFGLKKCRGISSLSQMRARRFELTTSIAPCNRLTNVQFSHLCIATTMCDDHSGASQRVRTDSESNLRTWLRRVTCLPATLIVPYEFRLYGFSVADITAFTTLPQNVGDKTAVAAKLAKRTCLGDMSATFRRHMQLRLKKSME